MIKTSDFYNKESLVYSNKRYDGVSDTYVKFFFKKRLSILLSYFENYICDKDDLSLLEVGCADGVVIKNIKNRYSDKFSNIVGIDIAADMISLAQKNNGDNTTHFYVRGDEPNQKYDVILAVGFLSLPMYKNDFKYIADNLKEGGYFVWSLASITSLHTRIKLRGADFLKDFYSYPEYEKFISQNFEIIKKEPYGLFIPKLWAVPVVARVVQPILEAIFRKITPDLFHEKIYLLRKR